MLVEPLVEEIFGFEPTLRLKRRGFFLRGEGQANID